MNIDEWDEEDNISEDEMTEYCDNCQAMTTFTVLSISPRTYTSLGVKVCSCDICGDEVDYEF